MHKLYSLVLGALVVLLSVLTPGGANAAPSRGWTPIDSSYATNVDTPAMSGCYVSQSRSTIKMKVRAQRPNATAESIAVAWNTEPDFSGTGSSVSSRIWSSNTATVAMTLPKTSDMVISWQTGSTGYGYNSPKWPTTLNLARCP